ncbi:tripartite tricarboxylate transporter substrate binding protein [Orrella sp. JC864]|uniref:tripartite tricarboxylate transporter substrate binding protein n=1 Tax=Orrella sp. JC864 TaxID=3120298 RepID=UPI00300805F1
MKRIAALFCLALAASMPAQAAEFPARPLTIIVPAGAGGGGDTTTRMLGRELERIFRKPVTIINQGQGGGVVGLNTLMRARPDGYTVGLLFPYAGYKYVGQADFKAADFTPLGNFNGDSAALLVNSRSRFQSLKEALDAIKADPAAFSVHCSGACGSVWDVPVAAMMLDYGIDVEKVRWVPGQGAAGGLTELSAGGVDFQTASLPEAAALASAGHVRPLAVLSPEPVPGFEAVPLAGQALGKPVDGGTWRALAGPAGMPDDIARAWEQAIAQAVRSETFLQAMSRGNFGVRYLDRQALQALMTQHEDETERVMRALGYAAR